MKTLLAVLISSALFPQSGGQPFPLAHGTHPPIMLETTIRVPEVATRSALSDLVTIGLENHIPIGIIVEDSPDTYICSTPLNLRHGTMTIAELIAVVDSTVPRYRADLQNGVLDVAPASLPDGVAQLLKLKLSNFRSTPEPHQFLGLDLWKSIRGVLAPGLGLNIVRGVSLSAETVTGMDVTNENVKSVLNMIVDKGNGGVWILDASKIKELSPETPMPYEIYGYLGDNQSLKSAVTCSK
jgi:hypothetical protein